MGQTWMTLGDIMLSDISQSLYDSMHVRYLEWSESRMVVSKGWDGGALVFNEFVLQGPWTVVGGDGCVTM